MCNTVNSWSPAATDNFNKFLLLSFLPSQLVFQANSEILTLLPLLISLRSGGYFTEKIKSYQLELTSASAHRIHKPICLWTFLSPLFQSLTFLLFSSLLSHTVKFFQKRSICGLHILNILPFLNPQKSELPLSQTTLKFLQMEFESCPLSAVVASLSFNTASSSIFLRS